MKNIYFIANSIVGESILLEENEVDWKFCIDKTIVLLKDKKLYNDYLRSNEVDEMKFSEYIMEYYDEDAYVIESSFGYDYEDYYTENEIYKLINDFSYAFIEEIEEIKDSSCLWQFNECFVYMCKNNDVLTFDEYVNVEYVGTYNKYYDIENKILIEMGDKSSYIVYRDSDSIYYEVYDENEINYVHQIAEDDFCKKFILNI